MKFENWKIENIEAILPEEFFELIQKNKSHIHRSEEHTSELQSPC